MTVIFTYGYFHYKHKYREDIRLTTEKSMAKPIKLVMMSDLHLGYHNRREELRRWVDMMNEEHADAILIAGDIIDMSIRPLKEEKMYEEFKRLNAPVYACLGNHEYYSGEPDAQKFYEQAGIHLLRDSCAVVGDLCVIGRDDRTNQHRKTLADIMKQADRSKFTILLDHQPYHLEQAERQKIDFQFSGHTHHGQVWPISWITENIYECAFGAHQRGNTRYYVSSGIGIWGGKFRIGTRSEYIVATISHQ
jgi:predicted MPP superfamily phosphohydrolase